MLGKFRRFTNDRVSNRKRLLKDKFVELLGYNLISVRNIEKLSPSEKGKASGTRGWNCNPSF